MFRPLTDTLNRREKDITTRSSVGVVVRQAIQEYLKENHPEAVEVSIHYDPRDRGVIIRTPSKALAGELTLNTGEIRAYLAMKSVRIGRIVAR